MAAPNPTPTKVRLKLLIHPISRRVVFAEAGKDFVDFLFNIMSLPVATVITLLSKQGTAGCTANIYESVENLSDSYMLSAATKHMLLKPMVVNFDPNVALLFPRPRSSNQTNLYRCVYSESCRNNVTNDPNIRCPSCRNNYMKQAVNFVNSADLPLYSSEGGFVKVAATFMIMDDLVVRPVSTESILTLFNKFNIEDISDLKVKIVNVGINEAVELLREMMQSKTVLTTVFLGAKKEPSCSIWISIGRLMRLLFVLYKGSHLLAL